ncbi:uncharacterized protein LOC133178751 [Saccostrea echinata]|uniref:uncharacterized protein LOC133178751 n=1 Tax=Saccostrea echinata TaxID=191078 RepID=UPI002A80DC0B|nr:uncharacterized protein LOC133178751 [Saccostrea echinata]
MAIDRKISIFGLAAIGVLILGGILHIVALASPYWHLTSSRLYDGKELRIGNAGLWIECISWTGATKCVSPSVSDAAWMGGARAMAILGMLTGSASLIILGLYTFLRLETWSRILKLSAIGASIGAGVLILIGAVIYGASVADEKYPPSGFDTSNSRKMLYSMSWAFGLSITGAILCFVSAILTGFAKKPKL